MDRIEAFLRSALVRWVRAVDERARSVIGLIGVLTVALFAYAAFHLGINSDNVALVSERLEARQNYLAFTKSFPNIENVILVVVDGETPEIARHAAETLQKALSGRPDLFKDVYIPGSGPFFEKNGLLYRDLDDLDEFALQMSQVQPILASLERDPTVANLASLIQYAIQERADSDAPVEDLSVLLDRIGEATVEAYQEFPLAVSWEEILLRGSAIETVNRWIIVVDPVLDFDSLFAAARPTSEIRRIAKETELDPEHGIRVRITGNPVLNYEEMMGLMRDIGLGGVVTFFFVVFVLLRAFHSWRLVLAAIITLLAGLVWTGAFAAAAVGALNIISIAFGILFIGLGVDFTIHIGMAYIDGLRRQPDPADPETHARALDYAIDQVGSSLILCTLTTVIGFYVFIPTDNLGVAQLGLIAGSGMMINLLLTTTLFPALLSTVCRIDPSRQVLHEMTFRNTWWRVFSRYPTVVTAVAALLFVLGAWQATKVTFDSNVIRMRNPETESVQVFNELLEEKGLRSPWPMDTIAKDIETAEQIARKVEKLDVVDTAITIEDYIPKDQEEKIEILEDVGLMLDVPAAAPTDHEKPTPEEQVEALRSLRDILRDPSIDADQSALGRSMRTLRDRLDEFLARVDRDGNPEEALARLEYILLSGLENQLDRLREATFVEPIGIEDLPAQLRDRMLTPDGRARVQIFPAEVLTDEAAFTRFALDVAKVVPNATGLPMNMVAFAQATHDSFRQALVYAIVLISALLFLLWRRVVPVLLVLAPLLLSNVLTIGLMATFGIAFNFANVVVIPLLLGIGVDSGIHLVHRAESLHRATRPGDILESTTARAVFYSALTTTVSFGTLALSSHRGVASLGIVLTIGMILTVASNLIVLPALLRFRHPPDGSSAA